MQKEKIILGKEISTYPYKDLSWRSYFSESDAHYIIRKFHTPFQGSIEFYKRKFLEEHIAMLILAEFNLAPEAEIFVDGDDIFYRHKHIVLFQHKPQTRLVKDFCLKMEALNFIIPEDFSFTRIGVDVFDGCIKIFRVDDLVFSHLPLEILIKIQTKVHGIDVDEFSLLNSTIKVAEDYPDLLDCVANKNHVAWLNHNFLDFLDLATTDLYLQESKNIPFLRRAKMTGGAKIRLKR